MRKDKINSVRRAILHMTHYSRSSHIGSCLSAVEILYTLFFEAMKTDPARPDEKSFDRFILSKGHASAALYATMAERGYFSKDYLDQFYIDNGLLPGHVDMTAAPGLVASAGSLGHGLSIGVGMAIADKRVNNDRKVYVLVGDGECNEGSIWEAVMLAAQLKLNNLCLIVDFNSLQGFGCTEQVICQNNLAERLSAFGWDVYDVDGHDVDALMNRLVIDSVKPKAIIAHTIKGKGVSFMENKLEWHYKSPDDKQYEQALQESGYL